MNSTTATKAPEEEGFRRYILGKHIPSRERCIQGSNAVGDGEFGSRIRTIVEAGDIVCTTRGPHLRVALATFRCLSAHTNFILRPHDPNEVSPSYLEMVVRGDAFQDHLRRNFRGSTNLFVNWSDAARFEFPLPRIDEQRARVRVMEKAHESCEAQMELCRSAETARRSFLVAIFRPDRGTKDRFPEHWRVAATKDVGDVQLGQQRHPKYKTGDNIRPYLRVANVLDGRIDTTDLYEMDFPEKGLHKFELVPGDILLNEGQTAELVGRSAIFRGEIEGCCMQKSLVRFRCGSGLLPEFAHAYFQHCLYTGQFARIAVQTTSIAHLTAARFKKMRIPVPPTEEQERLAAAIVEQRCSIATMSGRLDDLEAFRARLREELLAR